VSDADHTLSFGDYLRIQVFSVSKLIQYLKHVILVLRRSSSL